MWEWRERYGGEITAQFKALGCSLDYADERFTMDDEYVKAVLHVFTSLYEKGLVYRDNYMVNWDPGTRSAISDLEVVQRQVEDTLYLIDYPLASGSGSVTVATVRPETMLADTAIAVNPADERYTRLVGEDAVLPLVGRRLPIVADEYVKTDFGTGALKITPGHDPNDFEIGRRHGLDEITVIGEDGRMSADAGERFAGLTRRGGAPRGGGGAARGGPGVRHPALQPRRSPLPALRRADRAAHLAAVVLRHEGAGRARDRRRQGRPAALSPRGAAHQGLPRLAREHPPLVHLAPAVVGPPDPRVVPRTGRSTWAPSRPRARAGSATPTCSTPGSPPRCGRSPPWAGPRTRPQLRAFYPTDALVTGRDIIFLWVARMVMMGVEFTGELPFRDVPINSIIQAPDGRRMSKSLGTGIDPLEEVQAHGADALRFGLLAMSSTQDVRYSRRARQAGARPGQQALERLAADPARACRRAPSRRRTTRRPWRTAGSCRAWTA